MKLCCSCKHQLPATDFHRDKSRRDGLSNKCKKCKNAQSAAWRERNPEYHSRWRERNSDYQSQWTEENPDYFSRYRLERPESQWLRRYKRRITAYGLTPTVEAFTKSDVIRAYGDTCFHCGVGNFEHLDHYPIPVAHGGAHSIQNVRPSCASCNLSQSKVRTTD